MRRLIALALACTLALSSTIFVVAEEKVEVPAPVAVYEFNDDTEYEVVSNGSGTVEVVKDLNTETGYGMGNVLHVPASGETDTEVKLPNPFAGLDLSEGTQTTDVRGDDYEADELGMPIWYEGVVINYWIKTVDETNSVILNFRDNDRIQYHKDDWRKHLLAIEAKEAYDKAQETGEPIDSRFELGSVSVYYDEEGESYKVYNGGGQYMTYNPDYEVGYKLGGGAIEVYKEGTDPDLDDNWVLIQSAGEDMYDAFYEVDYKVNPNSKVRQGRPDGFLQISLDGSFYFAEDDHSGVNENPNIVDTKNEFNVRNSLRMNGSTTLTDTVSAKSEESAGWHMVTVVIQNDWIEYYLDGEYYDALTDEFSFYGNAFCADVGSKSFNAGFGLKAPYHKGPSARTDYLSGNRVGLLLTEWLSLESTTFSIGGTNVAVVNEEGNPFPERVAEFWIDDVAFYDTLLDENQIYALYDEGLKDIAEGGGDATIGDVNEDGNINASDALLVLKYAAKMDISAEKFNEAAAQTNTGDSDINAKDALNILKVAAKLLETLPVQD